MAYILFAIIYFYICNWFQILTFLKALTNRKSEVTYLEDKEIISLIKKKTGLQLKRIVIFETKKLFGMMPGIPLWPEMILSRGLCETLNKDELEWVLLHEAGHCVLWHVVKAGLLQILLLLIGLFILSKMPSIFVAFLLGLIFALFFIRYARSFEYEADDYSISRVDNPRGVITAQAKMIKGNNSPSEKNILRILFYWNIMPSQRIAMARARLHS